MWQLLRCSSPVPRASACCRCRGGLRLRCSCSVPVLCACCRCRGGLRLRCVSSVPVSACCRCRGGLWLRVSSSRSVRSVSRTGLRFAHTTESSLLSSELTSRLCSASDILRRAEGEERFFKLFWSEGVPGWHFSLLLRAGLFPLSRWVPFPCILVGFSPA